MRMHTHRRPVAHLWIAALATGACFALGPGAFAQSHTQAQPIAIVDVRLDTAKDAPRKTLVLRDGRIEAVLELGATLPTGLRAIEGKGRLAVPAFIDAFTQAGTAAPAIKAERDRPTSTRSDVQIDMREANRKGIAPAFRAADVFELAAEKAKSYRESGFGWLVSAPAGELLAGSSVLATSRDAAARDQIVLPLAYSHGEFRASGAGYPGTAMGYHSQLRQFFLDATRQRELELRFAQRRPGLRPPFDADLAAVRPLLLRERRLMCTADSDLAIERWIKLADEQGVDVAIAGGREAHVLGALLAARKIPVVLTLEWGEEPKDPHEKEAAKKKAEEEKKPESADAAQEPSPAEKTPEKTDDKPAPDAPAADEAQPTKDEAKQWDYEEPLGVREEKRRLWLENRDCAMKLSTQNVAFAFGSAGASPSDLLKRVRTLVEKGLPREVALNALCVAPAQWLGLGERMGAISPGKDATFALWTDDPLSKDAQVAWMFVDGFDTEFEVKKADAPTGKPKEGLSAAGRWEVTTEGRGGKRTSQMTLEMSAEGTVTGTWTSKNPRDDSEVTSDVTGHLSGTKLTLEVKLTFGEMEITQSMSGELSADAWSGESTTRRPGGENASPFSASRKPKQENQR